MTTAEKRPKRPNEDRAERRHPAVPGIARAYRRHERGDESVFQRWGQSDDGGEDERPPSRQTARR